MQDKNNLRDVFSRESMKTWKQRIAASKFVVLIFYRGEFCLTCQSYIKGWNELNQEVNSYGGRVYGVSAQSQEFVDEAKRKWDIAFDMVSDPDNELAEHLGVAVDYKGKPSYTNFLKAMTHFRPNVAIDSTLQKAVIQPAVIVVSQDFTLLYKWILVPRAKNFFGAFDRPKPKYIWKSLKWTITSVPDSSLDPLDFFEFFLDHPEARTAFKKHLSKEFNDEMLLFLEELSEYRRQHTTTTTTAAQQRQKELLDKALRIYRKYIDEGAEKELNVPGEVREVTRNQLLNAFNIRDLSLAIETLMVSNDNHRNDTSSSSSSSNNNNAAECAECGQCAACDLDAASLHVFDQCQEQVKNTLKSDSFLRFVQTPVFHDVFSILQHARKSSKHTDTDLL